MAENALNPIPGADLATLPAKSTRPPNLAAKFDYERADVGVLQLGRGLQQLSRLIKADVGVEAVFAEVGGWDHHGNEPNQLSNLLRAVCGFDGVVHEG